MAGSRNERRQVRKQGNLDTTAFLKAADRFIDLANRENAKINATDLHLAFLFAAARYNAYVANVVLAVPEHEPFVEAMTKQYQDFLRQHLADPELVRPAGPGPETD